MKKPAPKSSGSKMSQIPHPVDLNESVLPIKELVGERSNLNIQDCKANIKDNISTPNNLSFNSKTYDTEIFLRKDISEEPIDLNPWCKEWSTSCLDEGLMVSHTDMQHEFCIGHFTSLQTLQETKSTMEFLINRENTNAMEHSAGFSKDLVLDIDQPILDTYNDKLNQIEMRNYSQSTENANGLHDISENTEKFKTSALECREQNIWEIDILQNESVTPGDLMYATSSCYQNSEREACLNIKTQDKSVMFSPTFTTENIFFESCSADDPMETYQTLDHISSTRDNDDILNEMELSNITIDEVFIESSKDFNLLSSSMFTHDEETHSGVEFLMKRENPIDNSYSNDVNCSKDDTQHNPPLSLKLVPGSSDCLINTPDVIANAISLEGDFNLLSYIEDDQKTTCVDNRSNDQSTNQPETCDLSECSSKYRAKTSVRNNRTNILNLTSMVLKKKWTKRGRPSKPQDSEIKVEAIAGESRDDFKYRELRNKNNEASRRSRMLRKEREMHIQTTLHDLEKRNLYLINNVSYLEDECNKYRKKLLEAMSK